MFADDFILTLKKSVKHKQKSLKKCLTEDMTCVQNHIKFFCSFRFSSEVKNSDMSFLKSLMTDFCKNQECFVILCSTTINHETSVKYYDKPLRQHELFVVFELHYQEVQSEELRQFFFVFSDSFVTFQQIFTLIQVLSL